jgi:hypothetical protein
MTTASFGIKGIANSAQKSITGASLTVGGAQTSVPPPTASTPPAAAPSVERNVVSAGGGHD